MSGSQKRTIILPSILKSFCSYSQIWTFCRLCRNLKIRLICRCTAFLSAAAQLSKSFVGDQEHQVLFVCS